MLLALIAGFLIVAFSGSVTNLIPLYTVGVFVAFTLSQSGMVKHHWKLRREESGWRWRAAINGLGAVTTGIVAIDSCRAARRSQGEEQLHREPWRYLLRASATAHICGGITTLRRVRQ